MGAKESEVRMSRVPGGGQLQKGLWAQSVQSCFGGSCSPSCGRKRLFHSDSGPSPAPAHNPGLVDRESVCCRV